MVIFHVAIVKLPESGENMAMTWAYRDMGRFQYLAVEWKVLPQLA